MIIVLSILGVILFPSDGYCFGPGFHLQIGYELLNYLTLFSPLTQQILKDHPLDFLYGCIMPDIIIGKRFMPIHTHCHGWTIAQNIVDLAQNDRQRAFAYGYQAHLAMDLVAHNFFIPYQMIATFKTRTLTHLYWETRLDNKIEKEIWYIAKKFKNGDFTENEHLLEQTLSYNLIPFGMHKKIYKGYIIFSSLNQWHNTVSFIKQFTTHSIEPEIVKEVNELSVQVSLDLLLQRDPGYIYRSDPMGKKTIETAQMIKRNLKLSHSIRAITKNNEPRLIGHFRKKLKKAFFRPDELLAILSEEF